MERFSQDAPRIYRLSKWSFHFFYHVARVEPLDQRSLPRRHGIIVLLLEPTRAVKFADPHVSSADRGVQHRSN